MPWNLRELKLAFLAPLLALLLIATVLRAPTLGGPGYALDEEITLFAVRGIQAVGLPLFPSGVLNDRGVPFSYAAWIAGLIFGDELRSYRIVSLLSGLATVLVLYLATTHLLGRVAAVSAGLLLAIFPLHIAVSGWARFYALAGAAFMTSVTLFLASQRRPQLRPWFVISVAGGALVHELCSVLVALPFVAMIATRDDNPEESERWRHVLLWCLVGVLIARVAVVGLHFLAPNQQLNPWLYQGASVAAPSRLLAALGPVSLSRPGTFALLGVVATVAYILTVRHRKAPSIFLAVCILAGLMFQLGVLAVATSIATLLRPTRAATYLPLAGGTALISAVFWTAHTSLVSSAGLTVELFRSLSVYSASYPLQSAMFFVRSLPVTSLILAGAVLAALRSPFKRREQHVRVLAATLALSLVLLDALGVAPNSRYYLVSWPIVLLVAAYAAEVLWQSTLLGRAVAVGLIAGLAVEHRGFSRENPVLITGGNPVLGTIERVAADGWSPLLSAIPDDAVVISNDELAAVYHVGRVDFWLTTSDWDLARYELVTEAGRYGEYAGARVISTADELWKATHVGDGRPAVVVLFRTGRFEFDSYRQMAVDALRRDQRAVIDERPGICVVTLPER